MNKSILARYELLARLDELDQLAEVITVPDDLTPNECYGAMLIASQTLEAIKARKKAIRELLEKLL